LETKLTQIRREVTAGTFDGWLELVFLPLYGKHKGERQAFKCEELKPFDGAKTFRPVKP
jgi:hypothetical protein